MTVTMSVGEATRDRILRRADQLFAAHGYAGVSMRLVAGAAGVTKPALYYHFRDKEALFEECVLGSQRQMERLLREAATGDHSLAHRVTATALVLLTGSPHHPVRTQSDIAEHLDPGARLRLGEGFHDSILGPVVELFAVAASRGELRDAVQPSLAAATLLGVVMAFLPSVDPSGDPSWQVARPNVEGTPSIDPAVAAELVASLVLRGVSV
ncbi:MAG TPA: TetR/AcrR family transcriptional regulator [Candidatus Dormibacteraeota bacterium]|nr:TetR/AcrR family transcriptional regulator [Candidatus Dormibacteraeota bacterium]